MKCGKCRNWYNDDGSNVGVCLFDQVEYHADTECKHPGYLDASKHDGDPCIPSGCAGCKHIAFRIPSASMHPCMNCKRAHPNDYYEPIDRKD